MHRPEQQRALLVCIALTTVTMLIEVAGGLWTGSLMLFSDALHMFSHSAALFISYAAIRIAQGQYKSRSHFGMYRVEILGALLNGLGVLALTGWITYEAIQRFYDPTQIRGLEMSLIAGFGLVINLITAVILGRAGADDINTRSAFVHMLGDLLSSVAILIGALILWQTGMTWIDPVLSLIVAAVILIWGIGLLKESCAILLEFAPKGREPETVRKAVLEACPAALGMHDLHIWEITSGYICMTAHVVTADAPLSQTRQLQINISEFVRDKFDIVHTTLQIEEAD
ncbi:MAG: cobalt-zinc-cadmium efflux system protein [Planctomycetota bacterium]|jgi:cobalt-zinc-cadmium efflux system protein